MTFLNVQCNLSDVPNTALPVPVTILVPSDPAHYCMEGRGHPAPPGTEGFSSYLTGDPVTYSTSGKLYCFLLL